MGRGGGDGATCGWSCAFIIFVVGIGLFGGSFDTIKPNEMGILLNEIDKSIDETTVYYNGRYFTGLGKGFIIFPKNNIFLSIDDVSCASADKQEVIIDISLQYKLKPSQIMETYAERQTTYESYYERVATEVIKEVAKNFDTKPDYYENRDDVREAMHLALINGFDEVYAELTGFQLLKINLADETEKTLVDTVVAQQDVITEEVYQRAIDVRTQSIVYGEEASATVAVVRAEADAVAIAVVADANAETFSLAQEAYAEGLTNIAENYNFTSKQLMRYLFTETIKDTSAKKLLVGVDGVMRDLLTTGNL